MNEKPLYEHTLYEHVPANVNDVHAAEKACGRLNQRIALTITKAMSAMPTFWLIIAWIALWIIINSTIAHFDPLPFPLLLALSSIPQLPLMSIIMIGQGLLGRKQELQSDEQYAFTLKSYHDIEQIMNHLNKQDAAILQILTKLEQLPATRKKVEKASEVDTAVKKAVPTLRRMAQEARSAETEDGGFAVE